MIFHSPNYLGIRNCVCFDKTMNNLKHVFSNLNNSLGAVSSSIEGSVAPINSGINAFRHKYPGVAVAPPDLHVAPVTMAAAAGSVPEIVTMADAAGSVPEMAVGYGFLLPGINHPRSARAHSRHRKPDAHVVYVASRAADEPMGPMVVGDTLKVCVDNHRQYRKRLGLPDENFAYCCSRYTMRGHDTCANGEF